MRNNNKCIIIILLIFYLVISQAGIFAPKTTKPTLVSRSFYINIIGMYKRGLVPIGSLMDWH